MKKQEPPFAFDQERAASHDERYARLAPLRAALHLLIRQILSELPADARVLCVGVGTGPELLDMAQAFPQWRFTAVEPSAPMLDVCRRRSEEAGVASRCTFHEGYLDSLPASVPFDAATCLLVSQFILSQEERHEFFHQIASRLRAGGCLVSCDLASDTSTAGYRDLLEVWLRMQAYTGVPAEEVAKMPISLGRDVAVSPPREIESMIASGGFTPPVLFFQALLIHAWYCRRPPEGPS